MKVKVLSLLVPALLVAGAANAAEIYNKDGNKLDLYGKIDGLHYFSDDKSVDGDQTYMRVGVKGETQINDQLTGYGQWEYNVQANNTESSSDQAWTRLAFAGLKFGDAGSFDYGRNYGVVYDVTSWTDVLPEFGGDTYGSDNFHTTRTTSTWPLSTPRPTTRPAPVPWALLTKRRTSKWLLSTSSTSVCVRPWLTCSLKVRIWKATATRTS